MDELILKLRYLCAAAEVQLLTDYSGRHMYGATCIAIVAPNEAAIEELADELRDIHEDLGERPRYDNLGYDIVAYWPAVATH